MLAELRTQPVGVQAAVCRWDTWHSLGLEVSCVSDLAVFFDAVITW